MALRTSFLYLYIIVQFFACGESEPPEQETPYTATGVASYYASALHGRQTASGEPYNQNDMTAAHLYLPLGTELKVENLQNGKSVHVRVNDRGPYSKDRMLDLSKAAADSLNMIDAGTTQVKITIIKAAEGYTLQDSVADDRTDELQEKTE